MLLISYSLKNNNAVMNNNAAGCITVQTHSYKLVSNGLYHTNNS